MNAAAVLERLREHGVRAVVDGQRLFLEPAEMVPDELLAAAREVKTDLVEIASRSAVEEVVPKRVGTAAEQAAYRARDRRLEDNVSAELRELLGRFTDIHERMLEESPSAGVTANVEAFTTCLDKYENGERLLRLLFGYEACVWGPDQTCPPDQPVACEFCAETGAWLDG